MDNLLKQKGISLVQVLILIAIIGLLIGGAFVLVNQEKAATRDAKRLADMARLQAAFSFLYNDQASYAPAALGGCDQAGMAVSQCGLEKYLPTIKQFKDPGKYSYTVSQVPTADSYQVTFNLEKSYDALKAGKHTLSPQGIR